MTEQIEVASSQSQAAAAWGLEPAVLKLAKKSGCPAFVGSRIRRQPLIAWLRDHPEILDADDDELPELKRQKLVLEVALLRHRHEAELADSMPTADFHRMSGEMLEIFFDEAARVLEPDHNRIFRDRCELRLSEIQTPFKTID